MSIRLSKIQATGNDFLVLSWLGENEGVQGILAPQARALCDRHRGVGADGLIVVSPGSDGADCEMLLFNADGGIAEMSGNGVRCLAWVAFRDGLGAKGSLVVDTGSGRREVSLDVVDGELQHATVDMGAVTFEPNAIPLDAPSAFDLEASYHGTVYRGDAAGIGNPHFVLFVDDVATARVTQHGPHLEVDERFPNRTNVEFVEVVDRGHLRMRVWERGVGETLSCGTGVCAAAAVARRRDLVDESLVVEVPGGKHTVHLGETVTLGGDVRHVFDVDVDEDELARSQT